MIKLGTLFLLLLIGCQHARYSGPAIDVHAHYLKADQMGSFASDAPQLDALPRLARDANVARTALIVMAGQGDPEITRKQNDEVIAYAAGGGFFPVCSVHPLDGDAAIAELQRLSGLGVKMIKLHPNTQRFDVGAPEVSAVVAETAQLGLVILFDAYSPFDANQSGKFAKLAIHHPKARLVLAHLNGPNFDEMLQFAIYRQFPWYARNVWVDLSAISHFYADSPYEEQLVWLVRQIGTDRALFGSDFPVDTPGHAREDLVRLGFTADEQRQILYDNAAALLGLK